MTATNEHEGREADDAHSSHQDSQNSLHEVLLYGWLGPGGSTPARPQDSNDAIVILTDDAGPRNIRGFRIGTLDVAAVSGSRVDVEPLPSAHQWRGVILGYVISGELTIEQGGHTTTMTAGDFAFYTGAQRYRITSPGPHEYLVVRIPTASIALRHAMFADVVAVDLSGAASAGVLAGLLFALASPTMRPTIAAAAHLGDAVVAASHAVIADSRPPGTAQAMSLFTSLVLWLEAHLPVPELSAQRVAEAHFLSVRHVRRLFAANGTTVSALVRQLRLEHIRDELVDPRRSREPVHVIAARWGISEPAVLSRAFTAQFGVSPRRYRALYLTQGQDGVLDWGSRQHSLLDMEGTA